jgi:acetyl esterase
MYREMVAILDRPAEQLNSVVNFHIEDDTHRIPARLYTPAGGAEGPVLLYFHGGGWVIGDLETHHAFCTSLARAIGVRLLAIDYRLAPEARFPAAHDDCLFAANWAARSPAVLGAPVAGIAVAGDSAGANLAAFVSSKSPSAGRPLAQLLFYPVTDFVEQAPSYAEFGEHHLLDKADMEWFRDHYLAEIEDRRDPRISILRLPDLSQMPPTVIMTCGLDPLRDEGRAFAARLVAAGVSVVFREAAGHVHGIVSMRAAIPSAERVLGQCIGDFKRLLFDDTRNAARHREED